MAAAVPPTLAHADADAVAALAYQVAWEPVPAVLRAARHLAPPDEAGTRRRFDELATEHGVSVYDRLLPELDALSIAHVATALVQLGFDSRAGRRFEVAAEAQALGIGAAQRKLFARLMQMLAEDGVLAVEADTALAAANDPVSKATKSRNSKLKTENSKLSTRAVA